MNRSQKFHNIILYVFQELLTRHKLLCSEFLEANYDKVFGHYQRLLNSENYVTRRQSLKLLGELLLDRHNFSVMTRYISNPDNLKLMMNMLKEKSRNIQFEAFHVFKVSCSLSSLIIVIYVSFQFTLLRCLHSFMSCSNYFYIFIS